MSDNTLPGIREVTYAITPIELFFDLVFAFAVSQLSHHLDTHLSMRGALETIVMLLTVLTVWSYTSWAATMIPAERARTRWMLLIVMLLGLFMNASITLAFTRSGWAFVLPLLVIQLGRTVWTIVSLDVPVRREHYQRVLVWFVVTTPLWLAGALAAANGRVMWWALASGVELVGTWLAHPLPGRWLLSENVGFDADHMLERCRTFLLIALGESILTTGSAIIDVSGMGLTLPTLVTGTLAMVATTALWAQGFGRSNRIIRRHVERTNDPIHASRHAVNAMTLMVAGVIALAVANQEVVSRPLGGTTWPLALLLAGGPFLFLCAQGWYLWAVSAVRPRTHLVGAALFVPVGGVSLQLPPWGALTLVALGLVLFAVSFNRAA
jgi:low temperature requirement protein LtrA